MLRRGGIILLILFEALWLNVVVPGHTRGVVTIGGAESERHKCCHARPADSAPPAKPEPDKDRASRCAVCFFAARLTVEATIDLTPAPLAPAGEIEVVAVPSPVRCDRPVIPHERAPPTA